MSAQQQHYGKDKPKLGFWGTFAILLPYFRDKLLEQVKSIWFIIFYLCIFQWLILGLPIMYSVMIGVGISVVAVGLMFFMEGLRLGLMPFGETIGAVLPRNAPLPLILLFAFILGNGATLAEPAISVLKSAGSGVLPDQAPLLYSLLNDFSTQLVASVAVGVGFAVLLGVLRFFYGWSLKIILVPFILILVALTYTAYMNPVLQPVIGLAWDCGAVTTGPVTVPLVIALGIGVCRIVGGEDSSNAGFGIVTLASLFPIIAVLILSFSHYWSGNYYGGPNYSGEVIEAPVNKETTPLLQKQLKTTHFSEAEFQEYLSTGELPEGYQLSFRNGDISLEDGSIVHRNVDIVFEKQVQENTIEGNVLAWNPDSQMIRDLMDALIASFRAIIPLCLFLFVTLRFLLREKIKHWDEMLVGVVFAVIGMFLFGMGIQMGLTPLGSQLGSNIPATFATIIPWELEGTYGPMFDSEHLGKLVAVIFAFFLGYGATLAEPALNALGNTVEKITVGAFRKNLLMQCVAIGVGVGIAAGVLKIAYDLPLAIMLMPTYLFLIFLTLVSSEEFVNFGWDSAGVTTGPITVPLVLSIGLGIGANVPGVIDGFGILALASAGPIITVLSMGWVLNRTSKKQAVEAGGNA